MAVIASDDFTYANNGDLSAASASWSAVSGLIEVTSNAVNPNTADYCAARWSADAFPDDQFSEATLASIAIGSTIGLAVRASAVAATYYACDFMDSSGSFYTLYKIVAGSWTSLGYGYTGYGTPVVVRFEAVASVMTFYFDGIAVGSTTDSSLTTGSPGVAGNGFSSTAKIDDWSGGDVPYVEPEDVANSTYTSLRPRLVSGY